MYPRENLKGLSGGRAKFGFSLRAVSSPTSCTTMKMGRPAVLPAMAAIPMPFAFPATTRGRRAALPVR
jgi:hypothetical protein